MALADLTGNGIPDLVVVNHSDWTMQVFLGNANGTFGSPTTYATGEFPTSVVVADVNGDGHPDILVSYNGGNGYSNNGGVDVFLGNGDGTFQGAQSFAAGINAHSLSVGDLTGNGKLDLVVANWDDGPANPNSLSVLMGNGNGTFQSPQTIPLPFGPNYTAVADVNGDGKPDIIVTGSGEVGVLLNNGNGSFQTPVTYPVGVAQGGLVVADVNGDGKPDILVTNQNSNDIGVLLGNGDGTFQNQVTYSVAGPGSLALADINGDGTPDLVVDNYTGSSVSVLAGNQNGTFGNATSSPVGPRPYGLSVADIDGDGLPELAVADYHSGVGNTVSVLQATGDRTFTGPVYTVDDPSTQLAFLSTGERWSRRTSNQSLGQGGYRGPLRQHRDGRHVDGDADGDERSGGLRQWEHDERASGQWDRHVQRSDLRHGGQLHAVG